MKSFRIFCCALLAAIATVAAGCVGATLLKVSCAETKAEQEEMDYERRLRDAGLTNMSVSIGYTPCEAGIDRRCRVVIEGASVADISCLQGMDITYLHLSDTRVRDLRSLQGMKLKLLEVDGTELLDVASLQGVSVDELRLDRTAVSDLSPLKGMGLGELSIQGTAVEDLTPLKGMPLHSLVLDGSKVRDLSPISGMALRTLSFAHTAVSDMTPLSGMNLKHLWLADTKVDDLSPLQGMELTSIEFSPGNITHGIDVVRKMAALKSIRVGRSHSFAPVDFWKKYDAGAFDVHPQARPKVTSHHATE